MPKSTEVYRPDWRKRLPFLCLLLAGLLFNSCSGKREGAPAERQYQLSGVVVGLDPKLQTANVQHGPVAGWMEAMTMDYPIRSKTEFATLHVGDRITATVNVRGTDYDLTGVKKINQ